MLRTLVVAVLVLVSTTACSVDDADERAEPPESSRPSTPGSTSTTPTQQPAASPTGSAPTPTAKERPAISAQEQADLNRRLIAAAWDNDVARSRRLIEAGADVNAKDGTEQSAYLIATSEGYLDLLELTLRRRADVHSLDSFNGTGLIRAAERGHADIVGRLLQTSIRVNHVNNLGWTALHEAIILGDGSQRYVDTVRLLVAGGADVTIPSQRDKVEPLEHARNMGFEQIATTVQRTLAHQDENASADRRLLRSAERGLPDDAALALRDGAAIETRDDNRRTPLLLAAIEDRVDVARLLVPLGASPDAQDFREDSAWLVTGVTGSVAMTEVLLPAHPDLALTNRYGGTSLIPASERGHVDYVRRVVETDVDVNHVNELGWTALLEAVILGDGGLAHQRIVRILLGAGADPSIADNNGVSALQHARDKNQDAIVRILAGHAG